MSNELLFCSEVKCNLVGWHLQHSFPEAMITGEAVIGHVLKIVLHTLRRLDHLEGHPKINGYKNAIFTLDLDLVPHATMLYN